MASGDVFHPATSYRGQIERRVHGRSRRPYYRYVIVSDLGQELFDGCAGDVKEANDSIKAHLQFLNEQHCSNVTPLATAS